MDKQNTDWLNDSSALDEDTLLLLAENQVAPGLSSDMKARMKAKVLDQIVQEETASAPGFKTIRVSEGEWVSPVPGAQVKILHQDGDSLTYLARLEAGFEMQGHPHPVDEECIMLEGDLWLGDLHLKAGDYHYAEKGVHHGRLKTDTGALVFLKGPLPV